MRSPPQVNSLSLNAWGQITSIVLDQGQRDASGAMFVDQQAGLEPVQRIGRGNAVRTVVNQAGTWPDPGP